MLLNTPSDARRPDVDPVSREAASEAGLARITALAAGCLGMPTAWVALGTGRTRTIRGAFGFEDGTAGAAAMRPCATAALVDAGGRRLGDLCVGARARKSRPQQSPIVAPLDPALAGRLDAFAGLVVDHLAREDRAATDGIARGLAGAAAYAFLAVDTAGTITFVNRATEILFDYAPGTMVGQDVEIIIPPSFRKMHGERFAGFVARAPSRLVGRTIELTAQRRDGTTLPIEFCLSTWTEDGRVGIGAMMRDISEWRARDDQLLRMAHHDGLTGLANRARFAERLATVLAQGHSATVMLLDLDGFKEVNDSLGHATGDALLQSVAVRLPLCVGADVTVARMGGDEFAILLGPCGDPRVAAVTATRILDVFQATFQISGHTFHVGLSLGVAIGHGPETDPEALIADADLALYQAKRDGRRCFRLFEPAMRAAVIARRTLHDELSHALAAGELVLHYQPQVAFDTGRVVGAEALLRWQHPRRGLLLPAVFLSALEAHPMATGIGRWIIDEACRQAAQWRAAGLPPLRVAINLFAAQLLAGTLAEDVKRSLATYRLPPSTLELEVTERIALRADDAVLEPIRALHAHGVAVAFDDFGTGYASLSSLKRFPLTRLKIDRSFVRDVLTDRHDAEIIRAILGMAQSFGLEVIAEGIEGPDQEAILRAMGCHEGQGYLYGKAMAPQDLATLIRERGAARPNTAVA
ncbi:EAL domain-containing protein [Methylobacterium sp. WL69]|uniref:putative bifunctional diguanylate cyclase/phosphodiesterase n=1 Tax=Methylobacterium sp. WL69 TaxID=2603893 RepID=UPI0011CC5AC7|nr:EAL domain-containing protein [Methylobacterium sp. WL69]TXM65113.1 EAL domain-containing protein [Methylobacterium sp. WL69]